MKIEYANIRSFRLRSHHLDKQIPFERLTDAAGACGLQNSPPGAWETALFNRVEGCTLKALHHALYVEKSLLQAWSFRGAPVVFPADQRDIFLAPMIAQDGEEPWIYTRGISLALDYLQMSFEELLPYVKRAVAYLDSHTVKSKESLDQVLAELIEGTLPEEKRALWRAPSMYGRPDRQTVGGAAVSFLLRPCSFSSLVVFGERQGNSPTFTSLQNWMGVGAGAGTVAGITAGTVAGTRDMALTEGNGSAQGNRALTRKFLHCYGPATVESYADWLGSSRQQARRLWAAAADEMTAVTVGNKTCFMLAEDMECLMSPVECEERLMLLGAHDPYLDVKDRAVLLEDKMLQRLVWKTVANPGVVLKGGRIVGIWQSRMAKETLDITMKLFEALGDGELRKVQSLVTEYAGFRGVQLKNCLIETDR